MSVGVHKDVCTHVYEVLVLFALVWRGDMCIPDVAASAATDGAAGADAYCRL